MARDRARLLAFGAIVLAPLGARAEEPSRPPLPESLLTESATDLDAEDRGEVEYEANFETLGARRGGAHATAGSLEVEWRVLRELGVRLEPSYARVVDAGDTSARGAFGLSGALAFGLFHDFARDVHLQAELLGRTLEGHGRELEAGESELPFAADLLAAVRRGRWTLRATVGAEAGAAFARAPMHTDLALLTGVLPEARFGVVALEARADWARAAPLVLAPEVIADTTSLRLPFRVGLALPVNVGAEASRASYGLFLRIILLTSREAEYDGGREGSE